MTEKTLLITRPLGDEQLLAAHLQARGHRIIHEPLTSITLEHTQRMAVMQALMEDPDAIIVTSRHAVHALALLTEMRDHFLICVGEATQHAAHSFGFDRTATAGGNVEKLIEYIRASYDEGSHFLYISGKHTRIDLPEALAAYDMDVQRIIAYEAESAPQLSDTLVEQIRRGQIDAVTFLSPRSAQIFLRLARQAGISEDAGHRLTAFCISAATAQPLEEEGWESVFIASEPTLASLVRSIDNAYGGQP